MRVSTFFLQTLPLVLIVAPCAADYSSEVLTDSPIAYWRLGDESGAITDASGNAREGFAEEGVVYGAPSLIPPDTDASMEFSGSPRIDIAPFEKIGEAGFSVEFWVQFDTAPGGFTNLVGDGEGGLDFMLMVYATGSGNIRAHVQTLDGFHSVDTPESIADGVPHHIVSTWDRSTGELALYIDGEFSTSSFWFGEPINGDNALYIGRDGREPGNLTGKLDEVALYDYPLAPERILAHYSEVEPVEPPEPHLDPGKLETIPSGLVTFIDFDEADGPVEGHSLNFAYDRVGSNHGTFQGRATRTAGIIGHGAALFDNSAGGVNLGADGFFADSGITVEAIIQSNWTGDEGDYDEIFRKEDGDNRILLSFQNDAFFEGANPPVEPGPVLSFGINVDGVYGELDMPLNGNNNIGVTLEDLTDGEPHHVAATYDMASGEKAIWIDGVKAWSVNLGEGAFISTGGGTDAVIGNLAPGGEPFNGTIDQFAFWDRALSRGEIIAHHVATHNGEVYFAAEVHDDYASAVLADAPLGYWRLGKSSSSDPISDASGNDRDGSAEGEITSGVGSLIPPDTDTAMGFGGEPRIMIPGFEKVGEAGFSVEFWVRFEGQPAGFGNLVGDGVGGLDFNLMVYTGPGGIIRPHVQTDAGIAAVDSPGIADGEFHHVVSTWDATTGDLTLYIDGASVGTTNLMGSPVSTGNPIFIGRDGREPGNFVGTLDEVAIYDYPLSIGQIQGHLAQVDRPIPTPQLPHENPGPIENAPEGLRYYIDFNEAAGPVEGFTLNPTYDRVGAAHGTLLGSTERTSGLVGLGAAVFDGEPGIGVRLADEDFAVIDGISVELLFQSSWNGAAGNYDTFFRKEDGDFRILLAFQNDVNNPSAIPPVDDGIPVLSFGLNVEGLYHELDMPLDGSNDAGITLEDLTDGETHHLVASYDRASGEKSLWIDGVKAWTFNYTQDTVVSTGGGAPADIGSVNGGESFTGIIDEFAFWERALTETEVSAHFANVLAGGSYFSAAPAPTGDFAVSVFSISGDMLEMTWNSAPEANYALELSFDLETWLEVNDSIGSEGSETTYGQDIAPFITEEQSEAYFRIRVVD